MGKSKRRWNRRAHGAHGALAETEFERALLGEESATRQAWDPRADRKTLQLCQQVRRALMLALAGECDDDLLREAFVESVEPMGNGAQLLVRVSCANHLEAAARLNAHAVRLRASVARAICRKRVPGLSFVAMPSGGGVS